MNNLYRAFGMTVSVPFPCSLLRTASNAATVDLTVVEGKVPQSLLAPVAMAENWQAENGRFLWKGGRCGGRFLVEKGKPITLQRGPHADDKVIAANFFDAVMVAALRQNGHTVLHANALITPRGAVAISGNSGAGKSTAMAVLLRRGCRMFSDDITALRLQPDGQVHVLPAVAHLSLCRDTADRLGHNSRGLPHHPAQSRKVMIPAEIVMAADSAPLHRLFLLRPHSDGNLKMRSIIGSEKFGALQQCIYGPLLPEEHPDHFPLLSALAQRVKVYCIERPADRWTPEAVADLVLHG